jgi:hypothetical protein
LQRYFHIFGSTPAPGVILFSRSGSVAVQGQKPTRKGTQLSQSNILRRHLHPALREVGFEKAGNHAFRRYRNTFLRNHTNCPESVLNFWLGWGAEGMSGLYDKVKADVAFRKEVANASGVGFDVPASLVSIEPIAPKPQPTEVAVSA